MIKINKKVSNQHANELVKLFHMLSLTNKYNIVGSYNTEGIFFPSDIDLNENIKIKSERDINKIVKKFNNLFIQIDNDPNIFFTDFKLGLDDKNESLHWSFDEIESNNKIIGDQSKTFENGLLEGTVKLDIVYRLNYGEFVEISMIYMINPEKINMLNQLKNDISEYLSIGRSFKALKRSFSYYSIKGNQKKLYKLIKLFNSDISLVAKVISEITIYIQLLEIYPNRIKLDEIHFSIQNNIKYYLGCIFRFKIKNKIYQKLDQICKLNSVSKTIIQLEKLNDDFKNLLEQQTKTWISFNKGVIP